MFVPRSLLAALAVSLCAAPALAQSITVPDYDFSDPVNVGLGTPSTSAGLGSWQVSPPTPDYLYYQETYGSLSEADATSQWYQQAGVFTNSPSYEYINNLPGSQAAFMFDTPGLTLSQTLSSTYQPGQAYQLTVGLAGGSTGFNGQMPLGDPMQIGLFYMSGGSQVLVGTSTITNDDSDLSGPGGYVDTLTDYTLTLPAVNAGDPWAGQNIGVALIQPDAAEGSGAYWDVDNVRLAAVPEPGSLALLAAGLGLLAVGGRWSLRKRAAAAGRGDGEDRQGDLRAAGCCPLLPDGSGRCA